MRKILLSTILLIVLISCGPSPSKNSVMSSCMTEENGQFVQSILGEVDSLFNKNNSSSPYKSSVNDLGSMNISPKMLVESNLIKFLKENEGQSKFSEIWSYEEGIYSINLNGSYFSCLKNSSDNKTLSEILDMIEKVPGISPPLLAKALESELSEEGYDSEYVKMFIAVNLYSEFALNVYDRFKK